MPEFIAVKCCNEGQCGLFQVVQKRKDNKWQCRLCNQKQSTQKIYAVSFKASDLRPLVQDYNMKKADTDRKLEEIKIEQRRIADELLEEQANAIITGNYPTQNTDDVPDEQPKQSRWNKYLEPETQVNDEEDEDDPRYTTVAPQGKRKGGKLSSKTSKKPNQHEDKATNPKTTTNPFTKSQNSSNSSSNYKPTPVVSNTASTFSRKFNQMFQSNSSDDEDSNPIFQAPSKPNLTAQPDSGMKNLNNNIPAKPSTFQQHAPSTSSGSRWSKYIEDNHDEEEDNDDGEYVTASAALDSRYQVVRDPEEDDE